VTEPFVNPDEASSATSSSLLQRVKAQEQSAWERLVSLYNPLVYRWCRKAGLQEADAVDIGQEVFVAVSKGIQSFRHDRTGDTFRGWLRTIAQNKLRDHFRRVQGQAVAVGGSDAQETLEGLSPASQEDEAEETSLLYRRALEFISSEFAERNRQAFWRLVVEDHHVEDVAADLNMTVNAVYLVKSRILRRLREEFADILD
jgi:RNA polymerase sigma-70 factor (ECF subfamily)